MELNNVLKFAGINWLVLLLLGGSLTFVLLDCTLTSNMLQHWALRLLMVRQRKKNPSSLCGFIYIVYIIFCLSSLIHTINIFSSSNQDSFVESEYLTQLKKKIIFISHQHFSQITAACSANTQCCAGFFSWCQAPSQTKWVEYTACLIHSIEFGENTPFMALLAMPCHQLKLYAENRI